MKHRVATQYSGKQKETPILNWFLLTSGIFNMIVWSIHSVVWPGVIFGAIIFLYGLAQVVGHERRKQAKKKAAEQLLAGDWTPHITTQRKESKDEGL